MILAHSWPVAITSAEVTINQDMKAFIVKSKLNPAYFSHLIRALTPHVLKRVETAAHGTKRLKTETVLNLMIPCPSMETQRKIVAYLDAMRDEVLEMQRIQTDDRSLLEQVEQSILAQAFRGEL
jgi:type I restriction enzyme, S subunit